MSVICCGAGQWANDNKDFLPKNAVCFCDKDVKKQGTFLHGLKVLSLTEALAQFPQYDVFLSVSATYVREIVSYLGERGIGRSRIKLASDTEQHGGCIHLEKTPWLTVGGARIKVVSECIDTLSIERSGNLVEDIKRIESNRQECRKKSFERVCAFVCGECFVNAWDYYPSKIRDVDYNIVFESNYKDTVCNARCCYCTAYDERRYEQNIKHMKNSPMFIEDWREIMRLFSGKKLFVGMAQGEMTISPWKMEVMNNVNEQNWEILVPTNCFVYDECLAEIAADGRAHFIFSLDAGTPETFKKVKGFDKLAVCVENIRKYLNKCKASDGNCLKYLLLEDINDKDKDFDEFIAIAKELGCPIMISNDNFTLPDRMNTNLRNRLTDFVDRIHAAGLSVSLGRATFQAQDYEILRELVR